jgi:hypothetical protein
MGKLQDDILEIYNSLVELSDAVLGINPCPVSVSWNSGTNCLLFECKGKGVYLRALNYYILRPDKLKPGWLLPEDYDELMSSLSRVIKSSRLLEDRICVIPWGTGFEIYMADQRNLSKGVQFFGSFKIISGTGWWFGWKTKHKYKNIL